MRPEFWQTLDRLLVVYPEATRADLQPALEVLYHALPQARLTLMACPESLQPPFPELEFHDAAIVFTTPAQSPYLFAYLCYLAGIPIRIGQSQEFGGGVLSHCIQPPLDPVSLPDYFLHLLKAVGLSACRTARPEARPETETNHLAHGALQSHGAIAPHHPVVTKSRMLN